MNARLVKPKGVKITLLDGVERELRFTLNALAELEDKYGSVDAAFESMDKGSIKTIRYVLWAGLLHHNDGLTEQQVGDLLDLSMVRELMQGMSQALQSHMGPDDPDLVSPVATEELYDNPDILPENRGVSPEQLPN